jgi:3-oxoacyl-[acyl-carrier-protein] synthase II
MSPLGRGFAATMDRLFAGDRAFGPPSLFDVPDSRVQLVAEVPGLTAAETAGDRGGEWSRTTSLAVHAAREALAQAGVQPSRESVDLVVGGTTSGMLETEDTLADFVIEPSSITPRLSMRGHPLSATSDQLGLALGPFRRARTVCSACSSGATALLLGAEWLRAGRSDVVLAGGADGLCKLTFVGFGSLAALSPEPCRPFDKNRLGLNLGEGAAFLVLERAETARARGARPLAELRGWAMGAEAHHITNPEGSGATAASVMAAACARAGLEPGQLDYVNAHGTATPLNDAMEAAALRTFLGEHVTRVPVSSSKGQMGHTLGAAAAIEAAICVAALARQAVPPTRGLEEVDPACELAHVRETRAARLRAVMSSSFGFGGTDGIVVLTEPEAFPEPPEPRSEGGRVGRRVMVSGGATLGHLGVTGTLGAVAYTEEGERALPGRLELSPVAHLDVARARRLDRGGRLMAVAATRALADAQFPDGAEGRPLDRPRLARTGAILATAYGSVDGACAYQKRVREKGAKYASPADFPNLVPSSPVGHVSIYAGLKGPVFSVSDLEASAESAVLTAAELVASGHADTMIAGAVDELHPIIEESLSPTCTGERLAPRNEAGGALVLEAEESLRARGGVPLAELVLADDVHGWDALPALPAPLDATRARVLAARRPDVVARLLAGTPWASVPVTVLRERAGDNEGTSALALAAAVGLLARRDADVVLVVGSRSSPAGPELTVAAPASGDALPSERSFGPSARSYVALLRAPSERPAGPDAPAAGATRA